MPRTFNGKVYRKHTSRIWSEYVPALRDELKEKGYLVRVTESWSPGMKSIWVYKKEQ